MVIGQQANMSTLELVCITCQLQGQHMTMDTAPSDTTTTEHRPHRQLVPSDRTKRSRL